MGFIQVIEYTSSQTDAMQAVMEEWQKATEGKRLTRRRIHCRDREVPGRYFEIVFFDSYEDAMKNSELPETDAFSRKMMGLADGPANFSNLEIVDDRSD